VWTRVGISAAVVALLGRLQVVDFKHGECAAEARVVRGLEASAQGHCGDLAIRQALRGLAQQIANFLDRDTPARFQFGHGKTPFTSMRGSRRIETATGSLFSAKRLNSDIA